MNVDLFVIDKHNIISGIYTGIYLIFYHDFVYQNSLIFDDLFVHTTTFSIGMQG